MGMSAYFLRTPPARLAEMQADPNSAADAVFAAAEDAPDGTSDVFLDVDKSWHMIHFLLTGDALFESDSPYGDVVMGGEPLGDDQGYGPARVLTPERVKAAAAVLADLPGAELWSRFDAGEAQTEAIYPDIWDEGDEARDYVLGYYEDLRRLYAKAAEAGDGMALLIA